MDRFGPFFILRKFFAHAVGESTKKISRWRLMERCTCALSTPPDVKKRHRCCCRLKQYETALFFPSQIANLRKSGSLWVAWVNSDMCRWLLFCENDGHLLQFLHFKPYERKCRWNHFLLRVVHWTRVSTSICGGCREFAHRESRKKLVGALGHVQLTMVGCFFSIRVLCQDVKYTSCHKPRLPEQARKRPFTTCIKIAVKRSATFAISHVNF